MARLKNYSFVTYSKHIRKINSFMLGSLSVNQSVNGFYTYNVVYIQF